jgi:hypothetical protein
MKLSSFFQTLIGSFYNPETYRDAVNQKKGGIFGYLAVLVVLCSIPLIVAIISGMNTFMKTDGTFILGQLPEITFKDGIASMEKESPYFIKSRAGETLFVIDLSDSAAITELQGSAKVLLTKDKLIAQQKENETRTYNLSQFQNFTLNAQKVQGWLGYSWIVYIVIFISIVLSLYIYRLVQALFNALLGLIISSFMKVSLDFVSLMYITMVAITPVAILASVIWATGIEVPAKSWLGFILALGYIGFGIMANKPQAVDSGTENPVSDPFETGSAS